MAMVSRLYSYEYEYFDDFDARKRWFDGLVAVDVLEWVLLKCETGRPDEINYLTKLYFEFF